MRNRRLKEQKAVTNSRLELIMAETSSSERQQRLERALANYLHAVEAGSPPDRDELLKQHPDLADDLRSFSAIATR